MRESLHKNISVVCESLKVKGMNRIMHLALTKCTTVDHTTGITNQFVVRQRVAQANTLKEREVEKVK